MRSTMQSAQDIACALEKVFGPRHEFRTPGRLPDYADLKKAFRLNSLHLHPDLARSLNREEGFLTREFQELQDAYRLLLPFCGERAPFFQKPRAHPAGGRPSGEVFWRLKRLPPFTLRFAQFLYYKGRISFQTLIRAIVWQSERRPRVGELAMECGALGRAELHAVFTGKQAREPFLSAAVRLGFLDQATRLRLLLQQRSYRLPIGRYFIEAGILTEDELRSYLVELSRHNRSAAK